MLLYEHRFFDIMGGGAVNPEEYVKSILEGLTPEDRVALIEKIRAILNSELLT